jgi:hypothetical protein
MSWSPEYLLQFLPPTFAVYLVLISGLAGKLVAKRVKAFIDSGDHSEEFKEKLPLIQNLVLSGILQIILLNSMFAAMASILVILRHDHYVAFFALLLILGFLIAFLYWLLALDPDDLTDKTFRLTRLKYASGCKIVLIVINILIGGAIWWSSKP